MPVHSPAKCECWMLCCGSTKCRRKCPFFFAPAARKGLRRCNTTVSVQDYHATGQSTPQNAAELGLRPAKCRKHMPLRGPDKMPTAHAGICWLALPHPPLFVNSLGPSCEFPICSRRQKNVIYSRTLFNDTVQPNNVLYVCSWNACGFVVRLEGRGCGWCRSDCCSFF